MATVVYANVTPYETRVAVREDGVLVEMLHERTRERSIVGSVFKGRISRVLPGMQAAFVDVGLERDAFLYIEDLVGGAAVLEGIGEVEFEDGSTALEPGPQADAGPAPAPAPRPRIEDLLRPGQDLVVQITKDPVAQKGVLGTANLLEALRRAGGPCAVVVVTSDKCYENREWTWGYREDEAMGGHDPYSASKGAAEPVVAAYRRSFFPPAALARHGIALASARAGNVVGGGDWGRGPLVPDCLAALSEGRSAPVRNPGSVRPWRHVLEPLGGYLLLGARLSGPRAAEHAEAWNFGPRLEDSRPVREVVEALISRTISSA